MKHLGLFISLTLITMLFWIKKNKIFTIPNKLYYISIVLLLLTSLAGVGQLIEEIMQPKHFSNPQEAIKSAMSIREWEIVDQIDGVAGSFILVNSQSDCTFFFVPKENAEWGRAIPDKELLYKRKSISSTDIAVALFEPNQKATLIFVLEVLGKDKEAMKNIVDSEKSEFHIREIRIPNKDIIVFRYYISFLDFIPSSRYWLEINNQKYQIF